MSCDYQKRECVVKASKCLTDEAYRDSLYKGWKAPINKDSLVDSVFAMLREQRQILLDMGAEKKTAPEIQPVIENAVEYSYSEDGIRKVRLEVSGTSDGDRIDMKIRIINPGVPGDEDVAKIKELLTDEMDIRPMEERSTRIGIRNVNRRLKILYGSESGLTIEPDGNGNTISTIFVKN